MPTLVWKPRWRHYLSTLFTGSSSRGQLDLQVLDDVMPVAPLLDAADPRAFYEREEYGWAWGTQVAAAVGFKGSVSVCGNAGSTDPSITVVQGIEVGVDAATEVGLDFINIGGALTGTRRDFRSWDPTGTVNQAMSVRFNAGTTGNAFTCGLGCWRLPAGGTMRVEDGWVLQSTPTNLNAVPVLRIITSANQVALSVHVWGYDVQAAPDESR